MVTHDREFYDRLYEIANQQMENNDFSADDFANEMNMGRTIFFKKVKGVTGYGPKEFMRIMRMKHAAELLLTTNLSISEIAYKVGMSDPPTSTAASKRSLAKLQACIRKRTDYNPNSTSFSYTCLPNFSAGSAVKCNLSGCSLASASEITWKYGSSRCRRYNASSISWRKSRLSVAPYRI